MNLIFALGSYTYIWILLREVDESASSIFAGLIIVTILFSIIAYLIDKANDSNPNDNFKGNRLFFRYGSKIYRAIVPIGMDKTSAIKNAFEVQKELMAFLAQKLQKEYHGMVSYEQKMLKIKDLKLPKDEKLFLKASFKTTRKSMLTYFICPITLGHQVIIHHYGFLRGLHKWNDALSFFLWAPLHIWGWAYNWVRGIYSIQNRLNVQYDESSFETINLTTIIQSLVFTLMIGTKKFAADKGLLTEELEKIIYNNINNSQNINIQGSRNFSLGNITASARSKS